MSRIIGHPVAPLLPVHGPVHVFLVGEAPGPRGADKSGYPFFGDAAGTPLYQVLQVLGAVVLPGAVATMPWDGTAFRAASMIPLAHGIALGNAFDQCPTLDGSRFRAPSRVELYGDDNQQRLKRELAHLSSRGLRGIVTMGRVAHDTIDAVCADTPYDQLMRAHVPHPSAQGLLSMAPNRGRGARMADLQQEWMQRCREAIVSAGFPPPAPEPTA